MGMRFKYTAETPLPCVLYLLDDVYRQFYPQVGCAPSTRQTAGIENRRISRWVDSVFTTWVLVDKKKEEGKPFFLCVF